MKEFLMRRLHPGMEDGILIEYDKVNMSVESKLCSLRVSSSMCIFGVEIVYGVRFARVAIDLTSIRSD